MVVRGLGRAFLCLSLSVYVCLTADRSTTHAFEPRLGQDLFARKFGPAVETTFSTIAIVSFLCLLGTLTLPLALTHLSPPSHLLPLHLHPLTSPPPPPYSPLGPTLTSASPHQLSGGNLVGCGRILSFVFDISISSGTHEL